MKSIKYKVIAAIVSLIVISSIATVFICMKSSLQSTNDIVNELYKEQLDESGSIFESYMQQKFGSLRLDAQGKLTDQNGKSIEGQAEYVDQFGKDMNMSATIFKKSKEDFVRVTTNIKNEKGERVVGTTLEQNGDVYKAISKGNEFIGKANIQGKAYIAKYTPVLDNEKKVIGIYYVGRPIEMVNKIINENQMTIVTSSIGIVLLILAVSVLISYFIGKKIAEPISALTQMIKKHSALDFKPAQNAELVTYMKRRDEIGVMANSLKVMEDNIREFIIKTLDTANQVATASEDLMGLVKHTENSSEQVAKNIEDIAKGANDQANDTELSTANVTQMGNTLVKQVQYIKELNEAALDIEKNREKSFDILKELITKTENNNEATQTIYEIIVHNNENAEKIENASSMIQSIADQTNLLALNAAIEAARAGEAGRGFAVVAEEIRKLAEQSNSFTEEIRKIIDELKVKSQGAVNTMNEVKEGVYSQTKSVQETQHNFEKIAESIETTKNVISKLTTSSNGMNENKDKLVNVMQNLLAISEENAAGTQEASATIEEQTTSIKEIANSSVKLSQIAEDLRTMIHKFEL